VIRIVHEYRRLNAVHLSTSVRESTRDTNLLSERSDLVHDFVLLRSVLDVSASLEGYLRSYRHRGYRLELGQVVHLLPHRCILGRNVDSVANDAYALAFT
jgi:hypothetical protein